MRMDVERPGARGGDEGGHAPSPARARRSARRRRSSRRSRSGTGCRRAPRRSPRRSGRGSRSSSARTVSTKPGVHQPHWNARAAANARCTGSLPPSASAVVTSRPATWRGEREAAGHRLAVEQHGAGAADADPARRARRRVSPSRSSTREQHLGRLALDLPRRAVEDQVRSSSPVDRLQHALGRHRQLAHVEAERVPARCRSRRAPAAAPSRPARAPPRPRARSARA